MSISAFALQQNFNTKNAMASKMISELLHVRKETIRESLAICDQEEHRLEEVLKINGVQYINDSQAVNVNAAYYALDSVEFPLVWIVGGVDRGNDYETLLPLVREKVKAIICLGDNNHNIIKTFVNVVDFMIETHSMHEAVSIAYKLTEKGDAVLLSPACEGHDMFDNHEDRGRKFKQAVRKL